LRPVAVVADIIRVGRRPRHNIAQGCILIEPVLFRSEYLLLVHVHAHVAPLVVTEDKPQLHETSGEVDGFARGFLVGAVLAGAISPLVAVERAEVTQEWVVSIGTIIVRHILAQLVKERQIAIEPRSVVATDRRGRAQKISVVKMMVVQVLNRSVARRESVGGLK